jgi:putative glutamine amidotransferase
MANPIIAVTTSRNQNTSGYSQFSATENDIQSLLRAGACPLMIPPGLHQADILQLMARIDGLMFTGGGDIHPKFYGSVEHPCVEEVDLERDQLELSLLEQCLLRKMPLLGICRGFQLINVGLGGALFEDIQDQKAGAIQHKYFPGWPTDHLAHNVTLEPGKRLAQLFGETQIQVNSLHHQGIRLISEKLEALAHAPDGLIEAFQIRDYPFGMAVQWHPEWMPDDPNMQGLFRSFVEAAQAYRQTEKARG